MYQCEVYSQHFGTRLGYFIDLEPSSYTLICCQSLGNNTSLQVLGVAILQHAFQSTEGGFCEQLELWQLWGMHHVQHSSPLPFGVAALLLCPSPTRSTQRRGTQSVDMKKNYHIINDTFVKSIQLYPWCHFSHFKVGWATYLSITDKCYSYVMFTLVKIRQSLQKAGTSTVHSFTIRNANKGQKTYQYVTLLCSNNTQYIIFTRWIRYQSILAQKRYLSETIDWIFLEANLAALSKKGEQQ